MMSEPQQSDTTDPVQVPLPASAQPESMVNGSRKRVRFTEPKPDPVKDAGQAKDGGEEVIQADLERKKKKLAGPRTLLPGEDEEDEEERGFQRLDQGPIKDFDPSTAAKRRAVERAEQRKRDLQRKTGLSVSIIPGDIMAAEEDYDEPEEEFLTGNIPVEPFHLRREREEGYFDDSGNYVQYRSERHALADAWLDTLDDNDPTQRVEGELANRLLQEVQAQERQRQTRKETAQKQKAKQVKGRGGRAKKRGEYSDSSSDDGEGDEGGSAAGGAEEAGGMSLSAEDVLAYRQRVVAMLRPGEDVLSALRRLGSSIQSDSAATQRSAAERQRALKQRRRLQEQQEAAMDVDTPAPHSTETAQATATHQQAAQHTATGPDAASQGMASSPASSSQPKQARAAAAGTSTPGLVQGGSGGSSGSQASIPRSAQRPDHASRVHGSVEFDKLTEYADLLLGAGDFSIYTKTRERLEGEVQRTQRAQAAAAAVGSSGSAADNGTAAGSATSNNPSQPLAAAAAGGVSAGLADGSAAAQLAAALLQGAEAGAVVRDPPQPQPAAASLTGTAPASVTTADDNDVDMFDAADPPAAATQPSPSSAPATAPATAPGASQEQGPQQDPAAAAQPGPSSPQAATTKEQPAGPSSNSVSPLSEVLAGFEHDPATGLHYNSALGVWYRPETQLFMDANTGTWYRITEDQQYEVVLDAGKGLPERTLDPRDTVTQDLAQPATT